MFKNSGLKCKENKKKTILIILSELPYKHKIWTPEKFAVIILNFEQSSFTIE